MFFKWLVLSKGGVDDIGREPADSSDSAVSVAIAHWNLQHHVIAVEQFFFRNSDSVVTVQRIFRHSSMLSVEVQFQIETLYSGGLKHLELPNLSRRVYTNRPRTIEELKLSIRQEIAAVPQKMLQRAMQDFEERLRMCVRQEGHHLTGIIFRA